MVDFRRWFPVLAVLMLIGASVAAAQPLVCTTSAVPVPVRAEGLAELVGDIVLTCQGGPGSGTVPANIQIFTSAQITNKSVGTVSGFDMTDATLLLNDAVPNTPGAPIPAGAALAGQRVGANSLAWTNVPVPAPPSTQTIIRITNVRVNANSVGTSGTFLPNTVSAFISISGTSSLPVTSATATVTVANVQSGFATTPGNVTLVNAAGSTLTPLTFQQCIGNVAAASAGSTSASNIPISFAVKFTEGFGTAFKARVATGGTTSQNTPGVQYNTESGLTVTPLTAFNGTTISTTAGLASQGTRLLVRFAGVPAGVSLFVTNGPLYDLSALLTDQTITATLVSTTSATGASGTLTAGAGSTVFGSSNVLSGTAPGGTVAAAGPGLSAVTLTSGAGNATWEITGSTPAPEKISFGVVIVAPPNTAQQLPAISSAVAPQSVSGSFAPITTTSTTIPRFVDTATGGPAFLNITACLTNLLFPHVTTAAGFDTGIAISNTSADVFGTPGQTGACSISYFGTTASGATAPQKVLSASISPGAQLLFTVNGGTADGKVPANPGFTGYMIAQCNFQYAHGFAFISNLGIDPAANPRNFAMGYLALILPVDVNGVRAVPSGTFPAETLSF